MFLSTPTPSPRLLSFLEKLKPLSLAAIFLIIGGIILASSYSEWRADPVRHYLRVSGTVLGHELRFDQQRWDQHEAAALVLETRLRLSALPASRLPEGREVRMHRAFKEGETAGAFIAAHPIGSAQTCLADPAADDAQWDHWWPPQGAEMIGGGVFVLIGLAVPFFSTIKAHAMMPLLVVCCFIFAFVGVMAARESWADARRHVQAADWPQVSFQKLGERTMRSSRSSSQEIALRYVDHGHTYDSIEPLGPFTALRAVSGQCRIDPTHPWKVYLDWGWRPGLAANILFPLPFLTFGIGGLLTLIIPALRRLVAEGLDRGPAPSWGKVIVSGGLLIFTGSIVGAFVAMCLESWLARQALSWLFTLFLLPFVFLAGRVAVTFMRSFRAAWRAKIARAST